MSSTYIALPGYSITATDIPIGTLITGADPNCLLYTNNNSEIETDPDLTWKNGRLGIGTDDPVSTIEAYSVLTDDDGFAFYGSGTLFQDTNGDFSITGFYGDAALRPQGHTNTSSDAARGIYSVARVYGSGTVAGVVGVGAVFDNINNAAITSVFNFRTYNSSNPSGTITNLYGYYSADLTAATNNYGFYSGVSAGATKWAFYGASTAWSYFNGNIGIGDAAPESALRIAKSQVGDISGGSGISLSIQGQTHTDTVSSGTRSFIAGNVYGIPTINCTNVVTYTIGAAVYIAGAPIAGTNCTITNPYAMWIDSGSLRVDDKIVVGASNDADKVSITGGNLALRTAGNGFKIKEGTNARMGTSTLVAGTVTVSNTTITASTRIFLSGNNSSGTAGSLTVSARSVGTSFTITSTDGADTRSVAWVLFEPG